MPHEALYQFVAPLPVQDGVRLISRPRPFQHNEAEYDKHMSAGLLDPETLRRRGRALYELFRSHGFRDGGSVVEIGCGSGQMTANLATVGAIGYLLATDPSPEFCRITRGRLERVQLSAGRVDVAQLLAEDLGRLPQGSMDILFLRSVLHHIKNVRDFLRQCSEVLPPGGSMICEEPYYEGYLLLGFFGEMIPAALQAAGDCCTEEEQSLVNLLTATMQYYSRRDVDKSDAEDKHLFRPEELQSLAAEFGMRLTHYPNWQVFLTADENVERRPGYFRRFVPMYLRVCMNWPPEFVERVERATDRHLRYFDVIESEPSAGPQCFGTFVFTKLPG